jgi:hypothetical protein
MPEKRRLLIDDAGNDRDVYAPGDAEFSNAGLDRRQQMHGHAEQPAQLRVPFTAGEIHQSGARCGDDIGRIAAAQAVEKERVAGAEPQLAALGERRRAGDVVKNPAQLRRREIRVERKAGAFERNPFRALCLEPVGDIPGAVVLPDDSVVDRLAAVGVSGDDRPPWLSTPAPATTPALSRQRSTMARSSRGSCSTQPGCG